MAPTLGQTFITFAAQIAGTGLGAIVGAIILLMFRNVGASVYYVPGFVQNAPVSAHRRSMICILALYAIPLLVLLALKPVFFALTLLAINGAGTVIVIEYSNRNVPSFDSPPLRMAKLSASSCSLEPCATALSWLCSVVDLILRSHGDGHRTGHRVLLPAPDLAHTGQTLPSPSPWPSRCSRR